MRKNIPLRIWAYDPGGHFYRRVLLFVLLAFISLAGFTRLYSLSGQPIQLQKGWQNRRLRQHPFSQNLAKITNPAEQKRSPNYDRLLVILVEFQQELTDDPNTTGDGRFQMEADPSYLYSIASPPHDREYFLANLEALRYYYQAVSCGSYDLEYDIFPQDGSTITLPHPMGYYNPPGADSAEFTRLMEEYFSQSFIQADLQCPEINFSDYGHYMIIHAGSDWQHDVFGDTPSDIPSFFIRVGDDKAVSVDNGTHLIRTACNVPATISQDFSSETTGQTTLHSGYGALNAVIAHEFGHSLGLVDLYNVYNFQPMVGVFDIMDSGGSGVLVDQLNDGSLVMVEGILPALPGAFSRTLLFEDFYLQSGYLKDINQVELHTPLPLAASSMQQTGPVQPNIFRIPLTPDEYILVENRNVDPDNDGATAVFGALDNRVILYPTPINDPLNQPSYEYDYLLPSFQRSNGDAVGGGILVWHINEDLLYNQGVYYQDGTWASNFENNTVNTSYLNRGVKVIEADGLSDIGNEWSWYWTGTQYEYFHKFRPVLDTDGYFQNWSQTTWKPVLGPRSNPRLVSSSGSPSSYWLAEIGNPAPVMNLEFRSGFFDDSKRITLGQASVTAPIINTSFDQSQVPVISSSGIRLFSTGVDPWTDLMGEFPYTDGPGVFPVTRANQTPNSYHELILTMTDRVRVIEFSDDALGLTDIDLGSQPVTQALAHDNFIYAATNDGVFQISNNAITSSMAVHDARRIAIAGQDLLILCPSEFSLVSLSSMTDPRTYPLLGEFGDYEPVVFKDSSGMGIMIILMSNAGHIWKWQNGNLDRIFTNITSSFPSQMGITATTDQSPVLFFALDSQAYAMTHDGSLLSGFPFRGDSATYQSHRHVKSITPPSSGIRPPIDDNPLIQLPAPDGGYLALSFDPAFNLHYSLSMPAEIPDDFLHYDEASSTLYWYYVDSQSDLVYHELSSSMDPIRWAGPRNGSNGQFIAPQNQSAVPGSDLLAYVYPSPVTSSPLRLRTEHLAPLPVEIWVFDVAGNLVLKGLFESNQNPTRDFQLDHKLASGVYFLTISNGSKHTRIKFAVIN